MDSTYVHCSAKDEIAPHQVFSLTPNYRKGSLHFSFWRGDVHCSTIISKNDARELADAILEAVEEIDEPNPNQQPLAFAQQQAA